MIKRRIVASIVLIPLLMVSMFVYQSDIDEDRSIAQMDPPINMDMKIPDSYFIKNEGQIDNEEILYYSANGIVFFTSTGITYKFSETEPIYDEGSDIDPFSDPIRSIPTSYNERGVVLKYSFVGANIVDPEGRDRCSWNTNYFLGNDPQKWRTDVPNYNEIFFPEVWNGIDLRYYTTEGNMKYDLIVHPGADPSHIQIRIEGHKDLSITSDGSLRIDPGMGEEWILYDTELEVFYQDDIGKKISSRFVLDEDTYSFDLGDYDAFETIIIDPLVYSTFIGGSNTDVLTSISIDDEGCTYVCGYTLSTDSPTTIGAYDRTHNGDYDITILKLNENGTGLVYFTYLGGGEQDLGFDMAVNDNGSAYLTGTTKSTAFPVTSGAYDTTFGYGSMVFLTKLNQTGNSLVYSTYLGGSGYDTATSICVDDEDNAFVAGYTNWAKDFPVTPGAYDTNSRENAAFVTKFNNTGKGLIFSTFMGNNLGLLRDITIDDTGCAYATGYGGSGTNKNDAYVLKLSNDGSSMKYSTTLSGSEDDYGMSIVVDRDGNAYVTGDSASNNFPTTSLAYDTSHNGDFDSFVTKLNETGSLLYSTFLGGSSNDRATGVMVDDNGFVYIVGYTSSTNFPVVTGAYDTSLGGSSDCFIARFNNTLGSLEYSSYIGGSSGDSGQGIWVDNIGHSHISGNTGSSNFPTTSGAYDTTLNGVGDGFILKLMTDIIKPKANAGPDKTIEMGDTLLLNGSRSSDDFGILNYTWTVYEESTVDLYGMTASHRFDHAGIFSIYLNVTDGAGLWDVDIMNVTVLDTESPFADAGPDQIIDQGFTVTFNGSGSKDNMGIVDFTWSFTDGIDDVILFGEIANHTFIKAGTFEVTLNATDLAGNWGIDTMNVTVNDTTPPVAVAGSNIVVDQFQTVEFNGSESSDNIMIVNWTWTFIYNGSDIELYNETAYFRYDIPGIYEVTLTVSDERNNLDSDIIHVTVLDIIYPHANAGPDAIVEMGEMVTLDGSGSYDNVDIVNYTWTFFDITPVTLYGIYPTYLFNNAGTFVVALNVTDERGLWDIDNVQIMVIDTQLPIADAGDDRQVNMGDTLVFDGSRSSDNVAVVNWTWTFIDMIPITLYGVSPSHRFDNAGTFEVMLRVKDDAGNWNNDTVQIVVIDTELPLADAGPDQYCNMGDTIVFNGNRSSDNVGVVLWKWSFHDGINNALIDGISFEWTFLVPGLYLITLNVSDAAGNWDLDTLFVIVNDTEDPVAVAGQDQIVDMGIRVFFNASGSSDNVNIIRYEWSFNDGTNDVILEGIIQNWTFTIPKIYTISLTVYDEAGNFHIDSMNVTVNDSRAPVADAGPDLSIKVGEVLRFNGSRSSDNVGITNYSWSFTHDGKDVVLYGIDPVFIFEISGDYIVTLEVRDGNGNVGEDTIEITVLDDGSRTELKDLLDYWWIVLILILFIVGYYVYMRFGNKGVASEE